MPATDQPASNEICAERRLARSETLFSDEQTARQARRSRPTRRVCTFITEHRGAANVVTGRPVAILRFLVLFAGPSTSLQALNRMGNNRQPI